MRRKAKNYWGKLRKIVLLTIRLVFFYYQSVLFTVSNTQSSFFGGTGESFELVNVQRHPLSYPLNESIIPG